MFITYHVQDEKSLCTNNNLERLLKKTEKINFIQMMLSITYMQVESVNVKIWHCGVASTTVLFKMTHHKMTRILNFKVMKVKEVD